MITITTLQWILTWTADDPLQVSKTDTETVHALGSPISAAGGSAMPRQITRANAKKAVNYPSERHLQYQSIPGCRKRRTTELTSSSRVQKRWKADWDEKAKNKGEHRE